MTDRDKGRLFLLALVILGIVVTVLTDSCGPAPSPYFAPTATIYEYDIQAVEDQGRKDFEAAVAESKDELEAQVRATARVAASQYTYDEIVAGDKHVYEWVKDIDNFQLTCPTRILRRDGADFCVVVKCDTGGGVAISCGW